MKRLTMIGLAGILALGASSANASWVGDVFRGDKAAVATDNVNWREERAAKEQQKVYEVADKGKEKIGKAEGKAAEKKAEIEAELREDQAKAAERKAKIDAEMREEMARAAERKARIDERLTDYKAEITEDVAHAQVEADEAATKARAAEVDAAAVRAAEASK